MEIALSYAPPLDVPALLAFLGARAVPGVEELTPDGAYRRTLRLPGGPGVVALRAASNRRSWTPGVPNRQVDAELTLTDPADADLAIAKCRHLLDLDADPAVIDAHLGADPLLAPLVARRPGLRAPGHVDPTELVTRAILGQQVSVAGARTLASRLVAAHGEPLPPALRDAAAARRPSAGAAATPALTHLFPDAATIAALPDSTFAMPRARSAALARTCAALADGSLDLEPSADRAEAEAALLALKGIGPWTAGYVAMRALGEPDAWLPTDVGVKHGLARIGAEPERHERWRPWRSYALMHLWAVLSDEA